MNAEQQQIGNIWGTVTNLCQLLTIDPANKESLQRIVSFTIVDLKDSVGVGVRCEWDEEHPLSVHQCFALIMAKLLGTLK
jgi:hypothetical protein